MSVLLNKMICGLFSGPETKQHSTVCIHPLSSFPVVLGLVPSMFLYLREFQSMVWETRIAIGESSNN